MSELTSSTTTLQSAKRKAEQQLTTLQEEYEDTETEARENGEKLRKAMEQNARLQSEQMTTREHLSSVEKSKVRITIAIIEYNLITITHNIFIIHFLSSHLL